MRNKTAAGGSAKHSVTRKSTDLCWVSRIKQKKLADEGIRCKVIDLQNHTTGSEATEVPALSSYLEKRSKISRNDSQTDKLAKQGHHPRVFRFQSSQPVPTSPL